MRGFNFQIKPTDTFKEQYPEDKSLNGQPPSSSDTITFFSYFPEKKNEYSKNHPSSSSPLLVSTPPFCHHRQASSSSFYLSRPPKWAFCKKATCLSLLAKFSLSHIYQCFPQLKCVTQSSWIPQPPSPLHPRTGFLPHQDNGSNNGEQIRTMASSSVSEPGQILQDV